jgi:hypothetical protein
MRAYSESEGALARGLVFAAALVCFPAPAEAQYLDPGAGSIIVQAVVAGVVGAAAALKLYWGKISRFVSGRSKHDAHP